MKISVVSPFESPDYAHLLRVVTISFPDDKILDLSVCNHLQQEAANKLRQAQILSSHMVVVDHKWEESFEVQEYITFSQKMGIDVYIYRDGKFRSFTHPYTILS
jgi:hypothetical protein